MIKKILVFALLAIFSSIIMVAGQSFETDTFPTKQGPLKITYIGHASLMFHFNNKVIHVDPFSKLADYTKLPKADLVLITHDHFDHLDPKALDAIVTDSTKIVLTEICAAKIKKGMILKNGESRNVDGISIEALPAYNLVHTYEKNKPYHPKGAGNGYVVTFGDKRVYIAGDTENIPEMKQLKKIDIAFLPMNLPYTMTPEMVVDAVKSFLPKILVVYHFKFGTTDIGKLEKLMKPIKHVTLKIPNRPSE